MVARRELGHDAPVNAVQVDLAVQLVRKEAALGVEHGDRAFVTG